MLEVNNFDAIRIGLASPDEIKRVVLGRGHQARDHQLPHPQAGEGRSLRRAHLRSHQGLGVLLRQVQADPLQGDHLRQVRRGGHPQQGPPRADGPHQAGQPGQPHLVLQGHAVAARDPARHQPAQPGADPLLRPVGRHPRRREAEREGAGPRRRGAGRGPRPRRQGRRGRTSRSAPRPPPSGRARGAGRALESEQQRGPAEELSAAAQAIEALRPRARAVTERRSSSRRPARSCAPARGAGGETKSDDRAPEERVTEESAGERPTSRPPRQRIDDLRIRMEAAVDAAREARRRAETARARPRRARDQAARDQTLTESEYRYLNEQYGSAARRVFEAGMGAEAIRDVIRRWTSTSSPRSSTSRCARPPVSAARRRSSACA